MDLEAMRKTIYVETCAWAEEDKLSVYVNSAGDRVVSAALRSLLRGRFEIDEIMCVEECDAPSPQYDNDTRKSGFKSFLQAGAERATRV